VLRCEDDLWAGRVVLNREDRDGQPVDVMVTVMGRVVSLDTVRLTLQRLGVFVRDSDGNDVVACGLRLSRGLSACPDPHRRGAVPAWGRRPSAGWSAGQLVTTPLGTAFGRAPFLM
jgi:hypothetical protein